MTMAKGPHAKIKTVLSQADADADAKSALAKGGGGVKQERIKREAEKAELASYKLNRKKF